MNFTITTNTKDGLALLAKIALSNRKSENTFPMAIKVTEQGSLFATSQLITVNYTMSQEELGLVPALLSSPILLPEKAIQILLNTDVGTEVCITEKGNQLIIKKGKKRGGTATIASMDVSKFPKIEAIEIGSQEELKTSDLVCAIKSTMHSISTNNAHPIHTGLHFICDGETLTIYSCDGYKSSIYQAPYKSNNTTPVSVPRESVNTILSAISKNENSTVKVILHKNNRQAAFVIDSQTVIRTTLLFGEFIPYEKFFVEKNNAIEVDKADIVNVLRSIMLLSDKDNSIVFNYHDNVIEFSFKGIATEYSEEVSVNMLKGGEPLTMGVNLSFLMESLKAMPSGKVRLEYNGPLVPLTIKAVDTENRIESIIVPMRIK